MVQVFFNLARIKSITKIILLFILLVLNVGIYAQSIKNAEGLLIDAKKQISTKNYAEAIKTCNQILATDPESKDAHLLLADVYGQMDSVRLEILHLNKAGEIGREWEVVFKLGEAYYKNEDYSEALRYYNIYSTYPYVPEKRQFLLACKMASCKFAIHSNDNPDGSFAENAVGDGYWPTISDDGKNLTFIPWSKNQNQLLNEENYKLIPDSAIWQITKSLSDTIDIDNEGIQKLSDGSRILFFTACDRADGMGDCDIYFVKFENGKWGTPTNAGSSLNTAFWESQSSFLPDKQYLYFSSNRNGGKGKKDIWMTELLGFSDEGVPKWKEPVNMGSAVNTSGDETSPFIHPKSHDLYFVSDTHAGMGGKDLFVAEADDLGNYTNVKNLGYPINTYYDDFDLNLSYVSDTIYFTSYRQTEKGHEIFAFNLDRGLATSRVAYVKAKVIDSKTKKVVQADIKFEYQPFRADRSQIRNTDEKGEAMFALQLNRNYTFTVSEPGYMFVSKFLNESKVNSISEPSVLNIELHPIEIGSEVQLYNIYFETDSFRILSQSEPELQKIVFFLKNNTDLKIEIQGHTDSSGNSNSNKLLSERRAKSVVDYLVKNGIAISRLKHNGYGDKVPIASNDTPEGRMMNRRTTIKIIEK